jgi:ABC-2 type transport system permease protein
VAEPASSATWNPLTVWRIYRLLVGARIRAQLQYRLSLTLELAATTLLVFLDFVAILILFEQVDALAGWTVAEVALLYGIACVAFALTDLVIGHLDFLSSMIRDGTFDQVLTRPLPSLLQVVASDFSLRRLGKAIQGLAVLVVALAYLDLDWTVGRVLMLPVAIVAGAVIYGAVWVALVTIAFWIVDAIEVVNSFTYGGNFLSEYPLNVFAGWLRSLVVFVLPVAFVAYFPALYLLDKPDGLGFPDALRFLSPVVAALATLVAAVIWRAAVRRYRSVGS